MSLEALFAVTLCVVGWLRVRREPVHSLESIVTAGAIVTMCIVGWLYTFAPLVRHCRRTRSRVRLFAVTVCVVSPTFRHGVEQARVQ